MNGLLAKLLQKRGIDSLEGLSKEEKTTFDNYEKVLSKKELTIEDMKYFLSSQIGVIEGKWRDLNIEQSKKSEWISLHTAYKTILQAIDSPQTEREALESFLHQQLKT